MVWRRRHGDDERSGGATDAPAPAAGVGVERAVERLAGLGTWTLDPASGDLWCSAHLCELLGIDGPHELTDRSSRFLSRLAPHERRRVTAAVERCRSTGAPIHVECSVARDDGERRSLVVLGERARPGTDSAVLWGIVQDVTDLEPGSDPAPSSLHDPLTGLANRAWLHERAPELFARASRHHRASAVLAIDIDDMHEVNAAVGWAAGDAVLAEVAQRVRRAFRRDGGVHASEEAGFVTRLGGDSFAVVCEDVGDTSTLEGLCRRVAALLEPPVTIGEHVVEVTASVGAVLVPPGATALDDQLAAAETAMRSAKANGKRAHEIFSPETVTGAGGVRADATELERALADEQFYLAYQPKISVDSGGMVGVEALLRWQHPVRGLVAPDEFIPRAERTGAITEIGAWVIEEACRQARRWRRMADGRSFTVAVNVSALQIRPELVGVVTGALSAAGIPASALRLELTESVLMDDLEGALPVLVALADLGVSLSVDDFGTGHSSLAYLKRLPLGEVKIDRSFIEGLGADSDSTAIVAAVIAMAHALDLTVVAEGVETADQQHHLATLGCDEIQGFHVGRPASAAVIDARLRGAGSADSPVRDDASAPDTGPRVLVVDDASDVRALARVSLAAAGFDVREAQRGSDAVDLASRLRPDCVVLDVQMPGMSGMEVCRVLREDPAMAGCALVMLTGRTDAAAKVEAFSIGADEYIVKPFSPRELVSRVRAAIRLKAPAHRNGGGPAADVEAPQEDDAELHP